MPTPADALRAYDVAQELGGDADGCWRALLRRHPQSLLTAAQSFAHSPTLLHHAVCPTVVIPQPPTG